MKSQNKILLAFLLNLFFSVFEFIGGIITGSVAIASDAVHDLGDSISIGLSYLLERLSRKKPDDKFTYGYVRFSVLGSIITTVILLSGSVIVIEDEVSPSLQPQRVKRKTKIKIREIIFFIFVSFLNTYSFYRNRFARCGIYLKNTTVQHTFAICKFKLRHIVIFKAVYNNFFLDT